MYRKSHSHGLLFFLFLSLLVQSVGAQIIFPFYITIACPSLILNYYICFTISSPQTVMQLYLLIKNTRTIIEAYFHLASRYQFSHIAALFAVRLLVRLFPAFMYSFDSVDSYPLFIQSLRFCEQCTNFHCIYCIYDK